MRVLYLVPQPKMPNRIAAYTFLDEEIQALANHGVEAYVLSTAVPKDSSCGGVRLVSVDARSSAAGRLAGAGFVASTLRSGTVRRLRQPLAWYRSAWREHVAAKVIEEERIDIIHSHFAWPGGFGGMLARRATRRPLVASLRGTDILLDHRIDHGRRKSPVFDHAVRSLLAVADRTLYFSEFMRTHALALGAKSESTRLIRKGVDLSCFSVAADRSAAKEALAVGSRPMVLTVAGLIPLKGIHYLLEALSRLRDRYDFTFVVCGEGPERIRLEELSVSLGLGERTKFMGRVARMEVAKYFAACDVFVLASSLEAAGNVVLEAMASGRPVVCTDAGGPGEYVADGQTGFVVPVADVQGLSSRIGMLLGDPALASRLGAEGRRRAIDEFGYDRMVSDLLDVYREVLN
jgi:glycosyltransferase involved in cell wall biosynthesis